MSELSRREYFAGMALQGIMARGEDGLMACERGPKHRAREAFEVANALIDVFNDAHGAMTRPPALPPSSKGRSMRSPS